MFRAYKTSKTGKMDFPKDATVVCQGVEGAFSQKAAKVLFPSVSPDFLPSFASVFEAVSKGQYRYGILPLENSSAGSVTDVYDLFAVHNLFIARSVKIAIEHCLLTKCGTKLEDLTEIYTHEQAARQCSQMLAGLPNIKLVLCANTAYAAKTVSDIGRSDVAAIAAEDCAQLYGLNILKRNVMNNSNNFTRFVCISSDLEVYSGADKISLMLSLEHKAGALYEVLGQFAKCGLNLTKIESRPIAGTDFEFSFYFDFVASLNDVRVSKLIDKLEKDSKKFVFLGNYNEIIAK